MEQLILPMLENAASRWPDKTAFFTDRSAITFSQLKSASMAIGTALLNHLPNRGVAVLLLDARIIEYPSAMLGTLYTGGAYAPLDPSMPPERLQLILDRLQPDCILTDEKGLKTLAGLTMPVPKVISLHDALACTPDEAALAERTTLIQPDSPVSILFTSGSTGIPKGSIQTQSSYFHYAHATNRVYGFTHDTVLGNQSPFFYANSIIDLFPPLVLGASVFIIPASCLTFPKRFIDCIRDYHVTELTMTPSSYVGLLNSGAVTPGCLPELRWGIMSGESMAWQPLHQWMQAAPNAEFYHFYGSTEAFSIAVGPVARNHSDTDRLPSGIPFDEVDILFVDENGQPADPHVGGEMHVASPWVCAGYYHDPERTAAAFSYEPVRRFNTGDIGHLNEKGELVVQGRRDQQIKHHGYRMELGEAELAVKAVPGWKDGCLLFDRASGELCCFYTGELTEKQLLAALRKKLQKYMLPDRFIHLDEMPHTATTKIDRVALMSLWHQLRGNN